jgi:hypothetical protein
MPTHQDEMNSVIQLPAILAIGFTGHRNLADEPKCRKLIYDFLAEKKTAQSELLCGIASVAEGGDLLFAESCIALNIPLRILLPLPKEDFHKDFDSFTWSRAEQVLSSAISVEVVGNNGSRDECYYECGLETVQQSQLLLALWNGEPAQGLGGTEQIVDFAKLVDRPVVWIHSVTGAVVTYNEKDFHLTQNNEELNFLNRLPSAGTALADDSSTSLAEAWLTKLDTNALLVAPRVRRLAALPIVCTALAAFITGVAPNRHAMSTWLAIGAVLGMTATLLPVALRLAKQQALWVRIRTAAEVSRAALTLWHTPTRYQIVGPEILPELSGMLLALNYLKSEALRTKDIPVEQFKQQYLTARLLDQKNYFLKQSRLAAIKSRRYRLISKVSIASAIALSAWIFVSQSLIKTTAAASTRRWLPFATSALFQIATIAGALLVVNDCARRQRRYQEIHHSLTSWEVEFRAFTTWPPVLQVVNKIERALLVELLEWRALLQNIKMPRN